MVVLRRLCSLSPTIGMAFGVDSTVGERAGVRGRERAVWPPHPNPLPRNTSSGWDGCRPRGRGGRRPPLGECPLAREEPGHNTSQGQAITVRGHSDRENGSSGSDSPTQSDAP